MARGYRFGSFTFLVDEGRLLREARSVELQPKVYELLLLLLSRPGEVISRDDLYSSLWPDVSVSDDSLTQAIRRLRRALEDASPPRFVETVRSRGYRFIADVEPIEAEARATLDLTLIGRQDLMTQLYDTFALARLVTLTGFGGVGKSTIARHFARVWPTGMVSTCELEAGGASGTSEHVIAAVADALTLALGPGQDRAARVGRALSVRGRYLLVLDGFETLVEHAPVLVDWMRQAPELRILVTSRERLRLTQEHVIVVGPLAHLDACTLFVARAHAQRSGCCQGAEEEVGRIVATLDRLPLALELAAARMAMMSPAALLDKLGARLALLTQGPRDLPPRQQSLRATIAWSWRLLEGWEAEALTQCTVFRGGFTADAAAGVLLLSSDAPDAVSVVGALVDQSMMRVVETPHGLRFHLFDTVREYALEQPFALRGQVEARHGSWYARLAAGMCDRATEVDSQPRELANFACAAERGSVAAEDAAQLALLLADYQQNDAPLAESRHWAERASALAQNSNLALHNEALLRQSQILRDVGRSDEALAVVRRALVMATECSDRAREAQALSVLGSVERELGAVDVAQTHLERARELYRAIGDVQGEARGLLRLGLLAAGQARYCEGEQHYRTALAMLGTDDGNRFLRTVLSLNLGEILMDRGAYLEAAALFEAAAEANAGRRPHIRAAIQLCMGVLCHMQGEADKADAHAKQALEVNQRTGELGRQSIAERLLAWFALHRGDVEVATRLLEASLVHAAGTPAYTGSALHVCGAAALVAGSPDSARRYLEEAVTIFEEIRNPVGRLQSLGWLSAAMALQGAPEAGARLASARELHDGTHADFLAICADFSSLGAARQAWEAGDVAAHRRHLRGTRSRLGDALKPDLAPVQRAFANAWQRIDALAAPGPD